MKYMELRDFVRLGFLQEANRQFFHPLGLALEVSKGDDGKLSVSGVWDFRSDPEGIFFDEVDLAKCAEVREERKRHEDARIKKFGYVIQPEK